MARRAITDSISGLRTQSAAADRFRVIIGAQLARDREDRKFRRVALSRTRLVSYQIKRNERRRQQRGKTLRAMAHGGRRMIPRASAMSSINGRRVACVRKKRPRWICPEQQIDDGHIRRRRARDRGARHHPTNAYAMPRSARRHQRVACADMRARAHHMALCGSELLKIGERCDAFLRRGHGHDHRTKDASYLVRGYRAPQSSTMRWSIGPGGKLGNPITPHCGGSVRDGLMTVSAVGPS